MRIPTAEPFAVAPEAARPPARTPSASTLGQSVKELGGDLAQSAETLKSTYDKLKHEAAAKDASDGMTELTKSVTDANYGTKSTSSTTIAGNTGAAAAPSQDAIDAATAAGGRTVQVDLSTGQPQQTEGFLATRGEAAVAKLDDHLSGIDKARKAISAKMSSPLAREMFDKASSELVLHSYQQAKEHTAQQVQVAKTDSLKAHLAETLRSVAVDPGNDAWANTLVAQTAGAAVGMATSKADAANKVEAIRAEVAATRASVLLQPVDGEVSKEQLDKAEEVVKGSQHALGKEAAPLLATIEKHREVGRIQEWVGGLTRVSRLPNGQVDEAAVWDAVAKQPGEWQKKADGIIQQQLAMSRRAWDEETKRVSRESYSMVNSQGWKAFVADPISKTLNDRNPALWDQLKNAEQRDLDRLERMQRIRSNNRAAIREQADLDKIGRNEWEHQLLQDPKGADLESFIAIHKELSDKQKSELPNMQQKMVKTLEKGLMSSRSNFIKEAADAAAGFILAKAGTRREKEAAVLERQDFEAQAGRAYDAFFEKHERAPLPEDTNNMRAQTIRDYMSKGKTPLVPHTPDAATRAAKDIVDRINAATQPQPAGRKIPEAARDRAIARIKASGKPVTDDLIYQVYDYERQVSERKKGK